MAVTVIDVREVQVTVSERILEVRVGVGLAWVPRSGVMRMGGNLLATVAGTMGATASRLGSHQDLTRARRHALGLPSSASECRERLLGRAEQQIEA